MYKCHEIQTFICIQYMHIHYTLYIIYYKFAYNEVRYYSIVHCTAGGMNLIDPFVKKKVTSVFFIHLLLILWISIWLLQVWLMKFLQNICQLFIFTPLPVDLFDDGGQVQECRFSFFWKLKFLVIFFKRWANKPCFRKCKIFNFHLFFRGMPTASTNSVISL